MSRAVVGLILITLVVNVFLLAFEIRSLTDDIYGVFINQVKNVTSISAQSGDILSLQRELEALVEPIAERFKIDIEISRLVDQKKLVVIKSIKASAFDFLKKNLSSTLEVNPFGSLHAKITFDVFPILLLALLKAAISCIIIISALIFFKYYIRKVNSDSLNPIDQFSNWLSQIPANEFLTKSADFQIGGLSDDLASGFEKLVAQMKSMSEEVVNLESDRKSGELAKRLAHDIRSPLSALNLVSNKIIGINPEQREIIEQVAKRINDIANDLLNQSSEVHKIIASNSAVDEGAFKEQIFLKGLIDKVISEKRIEYSDNEKIILISRLENLSENAKIDFSEKELIRILSNLINNCVEAIVENGSICIEAWNMDQTLYLRVIDFGKGIPNALLEKLTAEPISSKSRGSGIGVYSAFKLLKAAGHDLTIDTKEGVGTQVTIIFKNQPTN